MLHLIISKILNVSKMKADDAHSDHLCVFFQMIISKHTDAQTIKMCTTINTHYVLYLNFHFHIHTPLGFS